MNVSELSEKCKQITGEVKKAIVEKDEVIEQVMLAALANGHVLFEDYPGLAKTLMANCFSRALGCEFKRVQFTPDLLPADITGSFILNRNTSQFELRKGPIFTNVLLADEINRAPPKTQSALLEAMQEYQVTLEGETMKLPEPFIVIATQNPIEYEGTFPLPEAQLDRFLVKLSVGYPTPEEEQEILRRRKKRQQDEIELNQVTNEEQVLSMRKAIEGVHLDPDLERYIVEIAHKTRKDTRVSVGSSPRGSLALLKLSMARAIMVGRNYVLPDDVKSFATPALIHRLILVPELWMNSEAAGEVIETVLASVSVPVIEGI